MEIIFTNTILHVFCCFLCLCFSKVVVVRWQCCVQGLCPPCGEVKKMLGSQSRGEQRAFACVHVEEVISNNCLACMYPGFQQEKKALDL